MPPEAETSPLQGGCQDATGKSCAFRGVLLQQLPQGKVAPLPLPKTSALQADPETNGMEQILQHHR